MIILSFFKKRLNKQDFVQLIYELGLEHFAFLKEQFETEINVNETLLYELSITTTSLLCKRIFYFKQIDLGYDVVDEVDKLSNNNFVEVPLELTTYYLTIKDELWEIMNNENMEVLDLAKYFIDEITQDNNTEEMLPQYMVNVLTDWHFQLKSILDNIKVN